MRRWLAMLSFELECITELYLLLQKDYWGLVLSVFHYKLWPSRAIKAGVLLLIQKPGSYWDRSSMDELPPVGVKRSQEPVLRPIFKGI